MLSVSAAPKDFVNPIAKVEYFASGTLIGTVTAAPYDFTWVNAATGNYTLTAKVTDSTGVSATSPGVAIVVASAPTITVAAGIDGTTVPDATITVTGTTQTELDSSVIVNGTVGDIAPNGQFVVPNVPLAVGANTLTVTVATIDGASATSTITVTRSGNNPISLSAQPLSGFAPQTVTFTIENLAGLAVKKVEMDFTGSGTLQDITSLGAQFTISYPAAGVLLPRVVVTDQRDVQYVATTGIILRSPADVDALARQLIGGMLDWLRVGDTSRALNRVNPDTRAQYSNLFSALSQAGTLVSAVDAFGILRDATVSNGMVEILLVRDSAGGQAGFWIYVIRGIDGIWRIDSM